MSFLQRESSKLWFQGSFAHSSSVIKIGDTRGLQEHKNPEWEFLTFEFVFLEITFQCLEGHGHTRGLQECRRRSRLWQFQLRPHTVNCASLKANCDSGKVNCADCDGRDFWPDCDRVRLCLWWTQTGSSHWAEFRNAPELFFFSEMFKPERNAKNIFFLKKGECSEVLVYQLPGVLTVLPS